MAKYADLDSLVGRTLGRRRYELVAHLASGGMAVVYRAHDRQLDRLVAVKVPKPEFAHDRGFAGQFRIEARTAARLSHPNIVTVYDSGEERGLPYIVMEHVSGRTLRDLLDTHGRLDVETTAQLLGGVADALDHAHHARIVHLDIKPENVLLAADTVKVADFGLVRAAHRAGEHPLAGTVQYLAPEVLQGGRVDGRADIFSLGVVAYECLTGRTPFAGRDRDGVIRAHLHERIPAPGRAVAGLPATVDAAVVRATEPDPTRRFVRAGDLAVALGVPRRRRVDDALAATAVIPAAMRDTSIVDVTPGADGAGRGAGPPAGWAGAGGAGRGAGPPAWSRPGAFGPWPPTVPDTPGRRVGPPPAEPARPAASPLAPAAPAASPRAPAGFPSDLARPGASPLAPAEPALPPAAPVVLRPRPTMRRIPNSRERRGRPRRTLLITLLVLTLLGAGLAAVHRAAPGMRWLPLSFGPPLVTVPPVAGKTQAAAEAALARAKLHDTVTTRPDLRVAKGVVIDSQPAAGTRLEAQRSVVLIVSAGKPRVQVPDVAGRPSSEARATLARAGLQTTRTLVFDDQVARGSVVRTDPPGGNVVDQGSTVHVFVSRGPDLMVVPDVVGMRKQRAFAALRDAGLHPQLALLTFGSTVAGQSIAPGTQVKRGTTVRLELNLF